MSNTKPKSKPQLKVIAIKPLKNCKPSILKVLKEDVIYFFYNNYKETSDGEYIEKIKDAIPEDFFDVGGKEDRPSISISAIVGKNGDGKSSLIELMIRILNNFAHVYGFGAETENLIYIEGINAELYFSISQGRKETIYKIQVKSEDDDRKGKLNLYRAQGIAIWNVEFETLTDEAIKLKDEDVKTKHLLPKAFLFFFTFVANYSLYAYNTNDYKEEWGWRKKTDETKKADETKQNEEVCWLDHVFHKNDGYQTPIVLHPLRREGNIDVNSESYLTEQRMISLFLTDDISKDSFRWIDKKQFAESIEFKFEEKSKLDIKTFYNFFKSWYYHDSYNDLGQDLSLQKLIQELINVSNKDNMTETLKASISKEIAVIENLSTFISKDKEEELIERAANIKKQLKYDLKKELDYLDESETDLSKLMVEFSNFLTHLIILDPTYSQKKQTLEKISSKLSQFNGVQLIRIALVAHYKEIWNTKLVRFGVSNEKLNSEIGKKLLDYLVYKSIAIVGKYPQYKWLNFINTLTGFFTEGKLTSHTKKCHEEAIDDILIDESHISLKIRQTLSFLNVNVSSETAYKFDVYDTMKSCCKKEERPFYKQGEREEKKETVYTLDITKYFKKLIASGLDESELINFLPPPIFNEEVILKQTDKDENSKLSQLSSGERQLMGVVSSVLYHLRNINSVKAKTKKHMVGNVTINKYNHVNLIFEEIELYFHPEFQRTFISYLLSRLSKIKLETIDSLNMCFVTHSPFILSDIPKNNVLFLEDGKPTRKMQEDTFVANIHTLLQNGFFLNNVPIGQFAKDKINSLFKRLHEGETSFKKEDGTEVDFYNQILFVSEPFIRSQLLKLYNELNNKLNNKLNNNLNKDLTEQIDFLKKEIEKLKNKTND